MTVAEPDVLAAIATGTGCGFVVLDEEGRIEYWSHQLEEVCELQSSQVLGQLWSELFLPSGFSETGSSEDDNGHLVEAEIALSGIAFYSVGDESVEPKKRVGILRLTSQYEDEGPNLSFAPDTTVGIPGRKAMNELIQSQFACQERYQVPFSLLFLRVKNYQIFVDVLDDESLNITTRTIFNQIKMVVRRADRVGLYDDATFWIVLSNSAIEGVGVAADKVRQLCSKMEIDSLGLFLSVSVGGVMAQPGSDCETMVNRGLIHLEKAIDSSSGLFIGE